MNTEEEQRTNSLTAQQDFVIKTIKSRDVHFIRCWFTDVLGYMKSFAVVPGEIEKAFEEGIGFDGSCIKGFAESAESDMLAFPDPSTFQVLPWRPEENAVARMFCDIKMPDGSFFSGDPRRILQKVVGKALDMGFSPSFGAEIEFFYFKTPDATEVLDRGSYFDLTSLDYASDLRRDTVLTLEKMGIPVEYSHHENAHSQHEIHLRYSDALSMADAVMTYKLVVKEIALKHGVYASFMPKPLQDQPGNGMHVHQSLFDEDGNNVFFDAGNEGDFHLSKIAKHYIAGILKYAPEFCLVTNQYVNSYKRLSGSSQAPNKIAWGRDNRRTMVRIPGFRPESSEACRVEVRNPDPAANPYLAFAVMIAAGLKGIEDRLELPPRYEEGQEGARELPRTLGEAVERFENSGFMKDLLGKCLHDYLAKTKRDEYGGFLHVVTPWELDRYLAVL